MARAKGFTLLEVLIGAVLIIIGVGSIGLTVVSLRRFSKGDEDRSYAMRLASAKLDEFLAKGYSRLEVTNLPLRDKDKNGFSWSVQVSAETASGTKANIPYKKVVAVVSYTADRGRGGINSIKNIRLTNILLYPTMHAISVKLGVGAAEVPWVKEDKTDPFKIETTATTSGTASVVGPEDADADKDGDSLSLNNLQWNVNQNIQVIYSIALNIEDSSSPPEIQPMDTVYTACFLDGKQYGAVTRTPLRSQPSFSNQLALDDVKKDENHTIEVRWYYGNAYIDEEGDKHDSEYTTAKIKLREAILTLLPAEPPEN